MSLVDTLREHMAIIRMLIVEKPKTEEEAMERIDRLSRSSQQLIDGFKVRHGVNTNIRHQAKE